MRQFLRKSTRECTLPSQKKALHTRVCVGAALSPAKIAGQQPDAVRGRGLSPTAGPLSSMQSGHMRLVRKGRQALGLLGHKCVCGFLMHQARTKNKTFLDMKVVTCVTG